VTIAQRLLLSFGLVLLLFVINVVLALGGQYLRSRSVERMQTVAESAVAKGRTGCRRVAASDGLAGALG
jgi:CHASE3 domain sensor protein